MKVSAKVKWIECAQLDIRRGRLTFTSKFDCQLFESIISLHMGI